MEITILRLGHRPLRDKRITTHVALAGRALGAHRILITTEDEHIMESVKDVVKRWGGDFEIDVIKDWKDYIKNFKGKKVHLTMYGQPLMEAFTEIKKTSGDLLIILGAEKVPGDLYRIVDYNIAVGNQPHSEVSALALFLDRFFEGKTLEKEFSGGELKIVPSRNKKKVLKD